jgi:hypothetical protein
LGWDIKGWIEIKPQITSVSEGPWKAAINVHDITNGRDTRAYACLFGFPRGSSFVPVGSTGLPEDISAVVKQEFALNLADITGERHVSWAELSLIDWDESATGSYGPGAIGEYARRTNGEIELIDWVIQEEYAERFGWAFQLGHDPDPFAHGASFEIDGKIYQPLRRRDIIGNVWLGAFKVMEGLAMVHGPDHVRLVVWFVN